MRALLVALMLFLASPIWADVNTVSTAPGSSTQDAFGRLRVSMPKTIFNSKQLYGLDSIVWSTSLGGAGTAATYDANFVSTTLTSGTVSGSFAVVQTRTYWPYQPAKSQLFYFTGNFMGGQANVVKRIGAFDERNGVFFQLSGTTELSLVVRSDTSGSVVDTPVSRTSWIDPLDGTGASGYSIDLTKSQIFVIDFEWLGVGNVRWGVHAGKEDAYAMIQQNVNTRTGVYMKKPNLPVRYEIRNVGTAASAPAMSQICSSVISEGGEDAHPVHTGAPVRETLLSVASGATVPLVSVRLRSGFERGVSGRPHSTWVTIGTTTAIGVGKVCYNCQVSGGSWISITNTAFEYNPSVTAITTTNTGAVILNAIGVKDSSVSESEVPDYLYGNYDYPQTTADIWTLYVKNVGGSSEDYIGGMNMDQFE